MANLLFAARESDSLRSENPGMSQPSRGLVSAILFADMRDYTRLTATLSPEEAVELLNGYFDCLVPPIEAQGGEVLKYMGDGLLAIFRERGEDRASAAQTALRAAVQALDQLAAANREGRFPVPVAAGVALHHRGAGPRHAGPGARVGLTGGGPGGGLPNPVPPAQTS